MTVYNSPIKIWFINHSSYFPEDGPHIRHYGLGKYIARDGFEPTVFTSNELHHVGNKRIDTGRQIYKEKTKDGVRFFYIKTTHCEKNDIKRVFNLLSFEINAFRACVKLAKVYGKPQVFYACCISPTSFITGWILARKYQAKLILETRDIIPEGFYKEGSKWQNSLLAKACRFYMRKMYEKADALVFSMSGGAKYLTDQGWDRAHGGRIKLNSVYYINNGVDLDAYRHDVNEYVLPDEDLDDPSVFSVVYMGSIRLMHNIPFLIETAKALKARGRNDIKLLIWGTGPEEAEIRRRLEEEKLDNFILKGFVDKKYIPSIASRGNLAILTTNLSCVNRYGASPNKLFDYLAAGLPVVVPSLLSDGLIRNNGVGLELDCPSGDEMADAIIRFADMDKTEYETYRAHSRKLASTFSYETLSKELERAIVNTLKG